MIIKSKTQNDTTTSMITLCGHPIGPFSLEASAVVFCVVKWPPCFAGKHWSCVEQLAPTVGQSLMEARRRDKEEAETVTAMASLTVDNEQGVAMEPVITMAPVAVDDEPAVVMEPVTVMASVTVDDEPSVVMEPRR